MVVGQRRGWCELADLRTQRIGFMQGRLSPQIDGRIQAFPWPYWQQEFVTAASLSLPFMEWTLDADRLDDNPLMIDQGRSQIRELMAAYSVAIPSLTGDCFMQAPFWKAQNNTVLDQRLEMFRRVVVACGEMSIAHVVVPLVDAGSIKTKHEDCRLRRHLLECVPLLRDQRVKVIVESDLPPAQQARLADEFPSDCVGINFDMGNSASLGWEPSEEIRILGKRIANVHVKDRTLGGGTVPLGCGAVDFPNVFKSLADVGYTGRFVLQTARAKDGDHVNVLRQYASFIATFLTE